MLREISETRQIRGEPRRRWFNSDAMDLYVWYDNDGAPLGFQLCYGKPDEERALTWFRPASYSHMRVDGGGSRGDGAGTPLLVLDGLFDPPSVAADFARFGAELSADIRELVTVQIDAFPE
jgi:hypothetical protein